MKAYEIKDNVLFQYTIVSFLMTAFIAVILSWVSASQLKDQLIVAHADFYQAYISAIHKNYSEIIPLIDSSIELEDHSQAESDSSDHGNDMWSHFNKDLLQFPSVKQVWIVDIDNNIIWHYSDEEVEYEQWLSSSFINQHDINVLSYHILDEDSVFAVIYHIPIYFENKLIGAARITDRDPNLQTNISKSSKRLIQTIFLGGFFFYLSLFLLFYRVYNRQILAFKNLDNSQSLTIYTMSKLAELKDDNTGAHINRTSSYCRILGVELSKNKRFHSYLNHEYIRDLERSAPLHDIGKVGIPDQILLKPGPLTEDEFRIIKTHPLLGAEVLKDAAESLDFQSFFEIGYQIVLYHHENWDGSGYPKGLAGEEIPLSARIMSIADVYDALTTSRPYKKAFSHKKAIRIIVEESNKKFDPDIVKALLIVSNKFEEISTSIK